MDCCFLQYYYTHRNFFANYANSTNIMYEKSFLPFLLLLVLAIQVLKLHNRYRDLKQNRLLYPYIAFAMLKSLYYYLHTQLLDSFHTDIKPLMVIPSFITSDALTQNRNTRLRIRKNANIKKNPKILNKSIGQEWFGNKKL